MRLHRRKKYLFSCGFSKNIIENDIILLNIHAGMHRSQYLIKIY
jgi:hypothetical protein